MSASLAILARFGSIAAIAVLTSLPCEWPLHSRSVAGVVTDKRENPLPDSIVYLENTVDLTIRSYITSKDGSYHFTRLNDDIDYLLIARYRNHWSEPKTLSRFNASTHPKVDLIIPIE